jgi:hypothetical protein
VEEGKAKKKGLARFDSVKVPVKQALGSEKEEGGG